MSRRRFWDGVLAGLDQAIAAWPPGQMSDAEKAAEMERISRRAATERAERDGLAPPWVRDLAERLDRIENLISAGIPRPGRCGAHPKYVPEDCSPLAYSCEHDAGHAGMHRDGTREWTS